MKFEYIIITTIIIVLILIYFLYVHIKKSYNNRMSSPAKIQFIIAIIALIAMVISFFNIYFIVYPPIKKPNVVLYTDLTNNEFTPKENNSFFNLYLYNGGSAPCFKLILITTPGVDIYTFTNQELARKKYGINNATSAVISKSPISPLMKEGLINGNLIYYNLDFILPEEIISLAGTPTKGIHNRNIKIDIECIGSKDTIDIKINS